MFTGFSITSVRFKFCLCKTCVELFRGRGEHLASSRASISLQAGRATRFERDERHASGGASISLRTGRASRFEQDERHASGGASISLRTGRASRFERGERHASSRADGKTLFTGFSITSVRFKFCLCKTCVELFRGRGGLGGRENSRLNVILGNTAAEMFN